MTEERYLALMREIGRESPSATTLEAIWSGIERAHFDRPARARAPRTHRWWIVTGLAAALVLGVAIGRSTRAGSGAVPEPAPGSAAVASSAFDPAEDAGPFRLVASEYLDQAATLLAELPEAADRGAVGRAYLLQAHDLLSATRLLLDSPAAQDVRMRALLSDLELVLAQVSHLSERLNAQEVQLINEALEQREVLPRLRLAAAGYPLGL